MRLKGAYRTLKTSYQWQTTPKTVLVGPHFPIFLGPQNPPKFTIFFVTIISQLPLILYMHYHQQN